jgi:hypothetical protein
MKIKSFISSVIVVSLILVVTAHSQSGGTRISLCCNKNSDLYVLLRENGIPMSIYITPRQAIMRAPKGTGVLILADAYPQHRTSIDSQLLELAKEKNLRVYVEYPASLPGVNIPDTVLATKLERGVVVSDVFGKKLEPMSILGISDCHVIPVKVENPLIVLGRVAGFDRAVYGVDDVKTYPILFQHGNLLVAMTRLSSFATGCYEPSASWKIVWQYILSWVSGNSDIELRHWLSYVSPMYTRNQSLPPSAIRTSVLKGVQWFFKGHFFVGPGWERMYLKYQGDGESPLGPPVKSTWHNGNGSLGIIEGHTSHIYYDGDQQCRYWVRADNQGKVAYALAAAGRFLDRRSYFKIASNLANFIFFNSTLRSGLKDDKNSAVFGLIGWGVPDADVFYEDDNAQLLIGLIGAEAYMKTD